MARQRHTLIASFCLGLATLTWLPLAQADKLSIFTEQSDIQRPARGMKMDAVLQGFGEPNSRIDAVGQPPISRWVYEKFTVYFENEYVIHAVINR